jgi:hypothetical protein
MLAACLAAAFAATATVLSVSLAATGASRKHGAHHTAKPKGTDLTKAEVIALVKHYTVPGPAGAAGSAGPKGETGQQGEAGQKGETGQKGMNGETGQKGETGASAAVAGYSASQPPTSLLQGVKFENATEGSPTTVLTKELPAGSFLASGKVNIGIAATAPGGEGYIACTLVDAPEGGSPTSDMASFGSALAAPIPNPLTTIYGASTTLPMELPVSTTAPSTLSINCWVQFSNGGENAQQEPGTFFAEASFAQIQAVQTTSNS